MTTRQQMLFDGDLAAYDKAINEVARRVAINPYGGRLLDEEHFSAIESIEKQLRDMDLSAIKDEVGDLCLACHQDPYICTCHMAVYE